MPMLCFDGRLRSGEQLRGAGHESKDNTMVWFYSGIPAQDGTRVAIYDRLIAFLCAGRIGIPPHLEYRMFTTKWSATYCLGMPRVKGPSEA